MVKANSKLPLKEWEETINKMSYENLQEYISAPGICYPEFLELAKRKMEELFSTPDHEIMKSLVKKCLEEMGCPCEIEEEGELHFFFQGGSFYTYLDGRSHYIDINEYCWKTVNLDDTDEVRRLKYAINEANAACSVTTYYTIDEDEKTISASCQTSILYRPMITNLKDYLYIRLSNFFYAHDLVNAEMTLLAEREKRKDSELNLLNIDNLPFC
jgi:hypothetical protein